MRLFFDVVNEQTASYDFHGREIDKAHEAAHLAELVATDLACSEDDDWVGSQVQVRNATGETLFAIPVVAATY